MSPWYSPNKRLFIAHYSFDVYDRILRRTIPPDSGYAAFIHGTSEEAFIVLTWDNKLLHYNGLDWANLSDRQLSWNFRGGLFLTQDAAFVGDTEAEKTFLLRGHLQRGGMQQLRWNRNDSTRIPFAVLKLGANANRRKKADGLIILSLSSSLIVPRQAAGFSIVNILQVDIRNERPTIEHPPPIRTNV